MDAASLRKARDYAKAKLTRLTTQIFGDSGEVSDDLDKIQAEIKLERKYVENSRIFIVDC